MVDAMQFYRDGRPSSASGRYGPAPGGSSSGGGSGSRDGRHDDDGRHNHNHGHGQSRPSPPLSSRTGLSSSRWQPPKGRGSQRSPDSVAGSNGGEGWFGSSGRPMAIDDNGGQRGGGKVNRQRRRSNDAHSQRNQHRRQRQPAKKKIVAPEDSAASSAKGGVEAEAAPKLDPDDPDHARRIRQRRRQVLFGKNTAGYEEYAKKVPRHKRRHRSPDCPMTPDHTLDIPTKRWQGLMNAWRRALHKYDPPDLHLRRPAQDAITLAPRPCATEEDRQQEEIARAKASGLQVAFGSMSVGREAGMFSFDVAADERADAGLNGASAPGGGGDADAEAAGSKTGEVPFEEEAAYRQMASADGGFLEEGCDSDSDDDLL